MFTGLIQATGTVRALEAQRMTLNVEQARTREMFAQQRTGLATRFATRSAERSGCLMGAISRGPAQVAAGDIRIAPAKNAACPPGPIHAK